jgi:hypothetical protein
MAGAVAGARLIAMVKKIGTGALLTFSCLERTFPQTHSLGMCSNAGAEPAGEL